MLHMGWRQLDAKCCLNSTFSCSTDFALLLHCIYTDFALLLCCVYNVFALLLLRFNFDLICTAFTLHLHCFCNFDWIALVCNFWHFWDSVALCHPLNYIRECKLFKRWTKIQIHITLTIRVNAHWWMSARPEKRCPALSRGWMHLAVMRKANEEWNIFCAPT